MKAQGPTMPLAAVFVIPILPPLEESKTAVAPAERLAPPNAPMVSVSPLAVFKVLRKVALPPVSVTVPSVWVLVVADLPSNSSVPELEKVTALPDFRTPAVALTKSRTSLPPEIVVAPVFV